MVVNRKPTGRAVSIPAGLTIGCSVSLAITLLGTAFLAKLIDGEHLRAEQLGYGIMLLLIAAAWTGSGTAWRKIRRRKVLVCIAAGAAYFAVLLLITALFFGGQYQGTGESGLMVLCGSVLPLLIGIPQKRKTKHTKIRVRNR